MGRTSTLMPYFNVGIDLAISTASFRFVGLQHEITAHCFFRFRERTVHHQIPVSAGDNSALRAERLARLDLAPCVQSFKPRHDFVHGRLELVRAKALCPNAGLGIAACIHLSLFLCSYFCFCRFGFGFQYCDERTIAFRTTISPSRPVPKAQTCCSPCLGKRQSSPSPARPSFPCRFCRQVSQLLPQRDRQRAHQRN